MTDVPKNLRNMTTANLIKRMEQADFSEFERAELDFRLEGTGYAWRWVSLGGVFPQRVQIYHLPTENLHTDDCPYMNDPDAECTCGANH